MEIRNLLDAEFRTQCCYFLKVCIVGFFFLYIQRRRMRDRETDTLMRERDIDWLSLVYPLLGIKHTTGHGP